MELYPNPNTHPPMNVFSTKEEAKKYLDPRNEVIRPFYDSDGRVVGWTVTPVTEYARLLSFNRKRMTN